jgi:hypothetical protein
VTLVEIFDSPACRQDKRIEGRDGAVPYQKAGNSVLLFESNESLVRKEEIFFLSRDANAL